MRRMKPEKKKRHGRTALLLLLTGSFALWMARCGPRHLEQYPPREKSPYRLPFEGRRWVCQGNNGVISHHGAQEFAYDFYMPENTPVRAARDGTVIATCNDRDSIGLNAPANYVAID